MNNTISLPTVFFPFWKRENWKYCYQIKSGQWIVKDYVAFSACLKMWSHCNRFGMNFRCKPQGKNHMAWYLLLKKSFNPRKGVFLYSSF